MGREKGACSLFSLEERVSSAFLEFAQYLELKGESSFKVRAYRKAIKAISALDEDLSSVASRGAVESISGVGKALAEKIDQMYKTGRIRQLDVLRQEYGAGMLDVMSLSGLGAKKTLFLNQELGVTDLLSLTEQLRSGAVANLKGFSSKSEQRLLREAEWEFSTPRAYLKSHLEKWGTALVSAFQTWPEVSDAVVVGAVRRLCPTSDKLELLLTTDSTQKVQSRLESLGARAIAGSSSKRLGIVHPSGCPVHLYLCSKEEASASLLELTGPPRYWAHLQKAIRGPADDLHGDETEQTGPREPATLPPELRHRSELWTSGWKRDFGLSDLGGSFHNHTTASDGANSLQEMAEAALGLGHRFLGISDHSRSLTVAGGLTEEELLAQVREIDELRERISALQLFRSNECDILADGSLDYGHEVLSQLDYVVVAVHSHFQQSKGVMTNRLLVALDHPNVRILAHPTGRILTKRQGYDADWNAIFTKCQENRIAVEINASPWRLDVSEELLDFAIEKGCLLAISPDAHSIEELALLRHGFDMLLRSKARKNQIVNLWSLADLETWFEKGPKL